MLFDYAATNIYASSFFLTILNIALYSDCPKTISFRANLLEIADF